MGGVRATDGVLRQVPERSTFDPIAEQPARHRRLIGAGVALLLLVVFAIRMAVDNPNDAIFGLAILPVALAALYLGVGAGVAAAVATLVLTAIWSEASDNHISFLGFLARGGSAVGVALLIGGVAGRLREAARADAEARARLASTVENANEGFVMMDAEGVILDWNPKAEATFGWTAEEAIGRTVEETIIPERLRDAHRQGLARFLRTGKGAVIGNRIEVEARHRDGHELPVEIAISAVAGDNGWTFHAFLHDISERRREEGIRSRMASIVEASTDAIFSYSLDGIVRSWNPGAERLYGYGAEEIVGRPILTLVPSDRPSDAEGVIGRISRGEHINEYETVRVAKGGRRIDVALTVAPVHDASGQVVETAVVAHDISDRKRQERYRHAQHRATRLLAESEESADAVGGLLAILGEGSGWFCGALWYRAGDDRRFQCVETWQAPEVRGPILPFELDEVVELSSPPPRTLVWEPPNTLGATLPAAERAARSGIETVLWVPVAIEGTVLGAVELMTRRRQERDEQMIAMTSAVTGLLTELLRRRHAESEADRLKDEFFGMVSHEMRTPLTSIIGYAELLGDFEGERLSEQGRGFLEVIQRNARREMRLVGDLLALVRIEAGSFSIEPETIDLAAVAREAVDAAAPRAEQEKVTLRTSIEPVPESVGDPHRLGQVIDNLLSNAIKFTPGGGEIDLRLTHGDGRATIEVADTGIGIPAGEQEQLFDRLYRASSATSQHIPGLGLGLTITKAIVEQHEGRISVSSEEGRGTTFRVDLPLRPPPATGDGERLETLDAAAEHTTAERTSEVPRA